MNGKMYDRSAAVLNIARHLRFPWPVLAVFLLVPQFLRDPVYDLVARNRKRWFGARSELC
jgi:predicted DCC family thiol-disulfide oxidoreductase YuxK